MTAAVPNGGFCQFSCSPEGGAPEPYFAGFSYTGRRRLNRAWPAGVAWFLSVMALLALQPASAQQRGGILRLFHWVSPPSMSIHEEAGYSASVSGMGVFNNLVLYKQDVPQNSLSSIVPDLATEWSWNDDRTVLTFQLRLGGFIR